MPAIPRRQILQRLHDMVDRRIPIVGGGAGTGLSAKGEEDGGIDLIIIYNSGRYRMAGRGSAAGLLAYGNANEIVKEMAVEVLPVVKKTPVLAGVNGTDPFVLMPQFLAELRAMGFSGVQNFPTVGLFDGVMRQSFEETGMGYGLEVDMIAQAAALDLLTTPYVFNPDEADAMTRAGADIIVAHMGVTTGGAIGATSAKSLDACVAEIDAIAAAARAVRDDVIVLCHG
ncbi:MAG: phosphoenolpyruvate hydrolase family protein, partial [Nitratireductor sp.]